MSDNRGARNFGYGKSLNEHTCRIIAKQTARAPTINRGDGLSHKIYTALSSHLSPILAEQGIKDLARAERHHLDPLIERLTEARATGELSSSSTSTLISALNTVFRAHDRAGLCISAAQFGLGRGSKFSNLNLANTPESQSGFKEYLVEKHSTTGDIRYESLRHMAVIQEETAARFRESAQCKLESKDFSQNMVSLGKGDGTKNNQERTFQSINDLIGTREAQAFQRENQGIFGRGSLIPGETTYREFANFAYRTVEEFRNETGHSYNFHGNRHEYAHESYSAKWAEKTEEETGLRLLIECPVVENLYGNDHLESIASRTGLSIDEVKEVDSQIRCEVAEELGHHRIDSSYSYLGK